MENSAAYNPVIHNLVLPDSEILKTKMPLFDFSNPPINPLELSLDLIASMNKHGGYGLSANQLGLPYRVFVMKANPNFVCFNPKIIDYSKEMVLLDEGCLSFPGINLKINRPKHIKVRFTTPGGETITKTFTGITARCFMHEMLHLDGELFFSGVSRLKMEKGLKEAKKKGYDYSKYKLLKYAA
jgi:peptide deformylase